MSRAAASTAAAPVRDRGTWLAYLQLAAYGYFLYSFTPTVPLLGQDEGVSRAIAGLHGTALAVGAVLAGLLGPTLVRRLGRTRLLAISVLVLGLGTLSYASVPVLAVTLTSAVLAGTFGSLVVNTTSTALSARHGAAGPAALSEANAMAAAMGVAGPAIVGGFVALGWGWRPAMWLVAGFAGLLALVARRVESGPVAAEPAAPTGAMPRGFWPTWTVLVLCVAVEFAITIWSSQLVREHAGLSTGAATAAVTAVIAGMTLGRALGGRLTRGRAPEGLLLLTVLVALTGFALAWVGTTPLVAIAGLFVVGLGIALQFPLNIARLIAVSDGRADRAVARSSLGVGMAIAVAPFALGALSDRVGVHTAFLVVPGLLVAAGLIVLSGRRQPAPLPL